MKHPSRKLRFPLAASAAALLFLVPAFAPISPDGPPPPAPNRFVGAERCKNCHEAKEAGDQFGTWHQQEHAKAFDVLASEEAKKVAAKAGVADPQKSDQCLKCHVTAFGEPKENVHRSFDAKLGVQCESCHGPGEQHVKARMKAAADEEEGKPPSYTKIPDDEIVKQAPLETCTKCHNEESPTYKPFCYHDRVAQIRHLNPLKPRTAEEKAALTACSCDEKCVCKKDSKDGKCTMPAKTDADGNPAPAAGTKDKDK